MNPSREVVRDYYKQLSWDVNEPYQIFTAPWNNEGLILMDDTGSDLIIPLYNSEVRFVDEGKILLTRQLPDGAKVQVTVGGSGHTYEATVVEPIGLD